MYRELPADDSQPPELELLTLIHPDLKSMGWDPGCIFQDFGFHFEGCYCPRCERLPAGFDIHPGIGPRVEVKGSDGKVTVVCPKVTSHHFDETFLPTIKAMGPVGANITLKKDSSHTAI
ncbi:hypothetical protein EMPG_09668 [Blastomyces silverae]|uniref:Uncharacterized protein n=1 Tax=Blastomyces silverae TaxID=2060906 RepID=A0A0H1BQW7_9EURO|nr:hypothetical protein EMPG_09668 [Blastomyces silverae]